MGRAKKEKDSQPGSEANQSDFDDSASESAASATGKSKSTAQSAKKTEKKTSAKRTKSRTRSTKRSPIDVVSASTHASDNASTTSDSTANHSTAAFAEAIAPTPPATWKLTEDLIRTLNQELGGLKEYVLADLRGEITTLRSKKLQLQTEINQLQVERDPHRQGQAPDPAFQDLTALRDQVFELKQALESATQTLQQALGSHESDLNERLTRMQTLEHQGEVLLGALVQRLQQLEASDFPQPAQPPSALSPQEPEPVSVPPQEPEPSASTKSAPAKSATRAAGLSSEETLTLSEFPADALFGRVPPPSAEVSPAPAAPPAPSPASQEPRAESSPAAPIPPFDSDWVENPNIENQTPQNASSTTFPAQSFAQANPFDPPRTSLRNPYERRGAEREEIEVPHYPPEPEPPEPESQESAPQADPFSSNEAADSVPVLGLDGEEIYEEEHSSPGHSNSDPLNLSNRFRSSRLLPGLSGPGLLSAALSLLLMALQYCTLHIIFQGAPWLGDSSTGLLVPSWASALLTFWIRMLMVLPFMIVIGQGIYPPLLEEMQELLRSRDSRPLISIVISSLFLFLSQFFLYYAIGISSASVALGLFFLYPLGVSFFGWGLLKRPLGQAQLLACLPLGLGGLILLAQGGNSINPAFWAALCFSLYILLGRAYTRRIHTLTLTVMQFGFAWLFSMPALFFLRGMRPSNDVGYVVACLVLSLTVFLSYFFNTASLNRLGPGLSRLINGWTPLLVALMSLVFSLYLPSLAQGLGLLLVTLGLTALNLEQLDGQN